MPKCAIKSLQENNFVLVLCSQIAIIHKMLVKAQKQSSMALSGKNCRSAQLKH